MFNYILFFVFFLNRVIGIMSEMVRETKIQSQDESYQRLKE